VPANELVSADQMAQHAEMRSQVYALFSHLYSVPPDHEFVKQLQDGGMATAFDALLLEEVPEVIQRGDQAVLRGCRRRRSGGLRRDGGLHRAGV
jgi:hypothetical protein